MHTNQTSNGEIIKFAQHENLNQNFSEKKEKKGKEKKSAKKSNRLALTPHQWKILNKSLFFNKEIINVESILKTSTNWSKKMAKSRSRKDSTKKKKRFWHIIEKRWPFICRWSYLRRLIHHLRKAHGSDGTLFLSHN